MELLGETQTGEAAEKATGLSAEIIAARQPVSAAQREKLAGRYGLLNSEFERLNELMSRLRDDDPAADVDRALELSRLIAGELSRFDGEASSIVAPALVAELLEQLGCRLEFLKTQRGLGEACQTYAAHLHQVMRQLMFSTRGPAAPLENLARRILLDVNELTPTELLSVPAAVMAAEWTPRDWRSEPEVYASGIQTARLLAFAAPRMLGWNDRAELLVVAALIQDAGLLLLELRHKRTPSRLAIDEPGIFRQHPPLSAALASGLTNSAVDLPMLIAQHHERYDGTGSPRGERAERLSAPPRLLAIAGRFAELLEDETLQLAGGSGDDRNELSHLSTARRLRREAEVGELDCRLTADFLSQLGFSDAVTQSQPIGRHFQLGGPGDKKHRVDNGADRARATLPRSRECLGLDAARQEPRPPMENDSTESDPPSAIPAPHFAPTGSISRSTSRKGAAAQR